jgi:hypothetical protein
MGNFLKHAFLPISCVSLMMLLYYSEKVLNGKKSEKCRKDRKNSGK